jgi:hypothetical protein
MEGIVKLVVEKALTINTKGPDKEARKSEGSVGEGGES